MKRANKSQKTDIEDNLLTIISNMKYILVDWPDIQLVMEDPEYGSRVYTGFSINSESDAAYFVPEDLYNKYFMDK